MFRLEIKSRLEVGLYYVLTQLKQNSSRICAEM